MFVLDVGEVSKRANLEHVLVRREVAIHHVQQTSRREFLVGKLKFGPLSFDLLSQSLVALTDTIKLWLEGSVHHDEPLRD